MCGAAVVPRLRRSPPSPTFPCIEAHANGQHQRGSSQTSGYARSGHTSKGRRGPLCSGNAHSTSAAAESATESSAVQSSSCRHRTSTSTAAVDAVLPQPSAAVEAVLQPGDSAAVDAVLQQFKHSCRRRTSPKNRNAEVPYYIRRCGPRAAPPT